jgi:glycosyltransferase involved in cell wall biosynthesis
LKIPSLPSISIIIPVRNGAGTIGDCLRSVQRQDFPADRIEILVVDNGSTDETAAICRRFGLSPLEESRAGAANARNRGLDAASGDIIAFTDADCEVPASWLAELVKALEGGEAATGWIAPVAGGNRFARARASLHQGYLRECQRLAANGRLDRLDTANAGGWREIIRRAGGFDPRIVLVEDRELGARLAEQGVRISFLETLRVQHRYESGLLASMRKARDTGRVWSRMREFLERDYYQRHFPDVLEWIDRARRSGVSRIQRRKTWLRFCAHLAVAAMPGTFRSCCRHYREASVLAIRLGVLDVLAGAAYGDDVRRSGET